MGGTQNKSGKNMKCSVQLKQPSKIWYLNVTEVSCHGLFINSRNKWRIIYNSGWGFCSFSLVLL